MAARSIIFDTGPIISLALNDLLWILEPLKKNFGGGFYLPGSVKKELVDRPIEIKRFKFEALRVLSYINNGVLQVIGDQKMTEKTRYLMETANMIFSAKGNFIQIVHYGEMESLAAAMIMQSSAMVIDERTTRMLIENPKRLRDIMEHKLHVKLQMDKEMLERFMKEVKGIKLIRSTELAVAAYDLGLLDRFIPQMENAKSQLLDGVLWGIKLNGCSISEREIETIIKVETKGKN
ncbi:hypothetical protein COV19_03790 [Candidatus Woesearchaeota archaeon CG10_big_fil_rev_8_21_14_0_10_44_13]|nr:MAG: hypothetical protein COV19_03790 [Candidatus Woesearchaeota archaeon CG10_big_fil_rev_8_21_14_0_10_44_13]